MTNVPVSLWADTTALTTQMGLLASQVTTLAARVASLPSGAGGGSLNIPGVVGVDYVGGVFRLKLIDGSTANIAAVVVAPPFVLPAGVLPHSLKIVNAGVGTPYPDPAAALQALADGGTINLTAGIYKAIAHCDMSLFPGGLTINGMGMDHTVIDGQGGIGAGHRLSFGKGSLHFSPAAAMAAGAIIKITGCGFINGGGADGVSDGEAGVYLEGLPAGTVITFNRCSFDACENGVFAAPMPGAKLVFNGCEWGRTTPNGLSDGKSHNVYANCELEMNDCIHWNCANGHGAKVRGPRLISNRTYYRHSGGRCLEMPDGGILISTDDTITDLPGASTATNVIAIADESVLFGVAHATFTRTKVCISRWASVFWAGGGGDMTFVDIILTTYAAQGQPLVSLANIGNVIGLPAVLPPPTAPLPEPTHFVN